MAVFHVCVCSFPSILVTVPRRIKARRVLHFAVYSGDYTFAAYFSVLLNQPGSHEGGEHWGFFFFLFFFTAPPTLRYLPSFFITRRVQPSLSLVDNEVEFCLLTKLFSSYRFPLLTICNKHTWMAVLSVHS